MKRILPCFGEWEPRPGALIRAGVTVAALLAPAVTLPAQDETPSTEPAGAEGSQIEDLLAQLETGKPTRHEIGASVDYLYGVGDSLIVNQFSFASDPEGIGFATPNVDSGDRQSDYLGATVSYSLGQAWYFDFTYLRGSSSADVDLDIFYNQDNPTVPANFTIDDDWYQLYVRYSFPRLRVTRYSAYVRIGFSLVNADIEAKDTGLLGRAAVNPGDTYQQQSTYSDYIGNFGIGGGMTLMQRGRIRLGALVDLEGFVGSRSLETQETSIDLGVFGPTVSEDPLLFGAVGRATVRLDYALQKSGLLHGFLDVGMQAKYTVADFGSREFVGDRGSIRTFDGGQFGELLWGPYVRLGVNYRF